MRKGFLLFILIVMFESCAPSTTVFFVRHCEKESTLPNADLNPAGHVRAQALAHVLRDVDFEMIYTTAVPRAVSTAEPLRVANRLDSIVYQYHDTVNMAKVLRNNYGGKNVMVVGHSDNVPAMIRNLGGVLPYHEIPLDEFDNLFVVTVQKKQPTRVLILHYGN